MPPMWSTTVFVGVILTGYGVYSYLVAVEKSPTALIPAFFGAGFIVLGLLSIKEKIRKHAMHIAAMVGVIGFLGGAIMGFPKLPALLSGTIDDAKTLNKARSQNLLAFMCLIFVALCVNSFIQARKNRKAEPDPLPK